RENASKQRGNDSHLKGVCLFMVEAAATNSKTAPILYSVPEAAAKLCVSTKWLYERTRKNAIPYRGLGKYVRFADSDLAEIVASAACGAFTIGSIASSCSNVSNEHDYNQSRTYGDAAGANQPRPAQEVQAEMHGPRYNDGEADRASDRGVSEGEAPCRK